MSLSAFGQELKVMSFNIRMSTDSDKDNSWKNRKEETLHLMDYYHPAILGVQEALPEQMKDIKMDWLTMIILVLVVMMVKTKASFLQFL